MFFFLGMYIVVRWTIPRFRFDQLMALAWKVMIPLSLLHMLAAVLVRQFALPGWVLTLVSISLFLLAGAVSVATNAGPNNAPRKRVKPLDSGVTV
jgi:NADH-quinone oxidoreductase subunit H